MKYKMGEMLDMFIFKNIFVVQKWNRNNMVSGLKSQIFWILLKVNRDI